MLKIENSNDTLLVLVSYLPRIGSDSEPKTKPTQHASRTLQQRRSSTGHNSRSLCRSHRRKEKRKIAFNCNVILGDIISAPNVGSIYEVPLNFEKDNLSGIICGKLKIKPRQKTSKSGKN